MEINANITPEQRVMLSEQELEDGLAEVCQNARCAGISKEHIEAVFMSILGETVSAEEYAKQRETNRQDLKAWEESQPEEMSGMPRITEEPCSTRATRSMCRPA
jgi:asparagine synthetase A